MPWGSQQAAAGCPAWLTSERQGAPCQRLEFVKALSGTKFRSYTGGMRSRNEPQFDRFARSITAMAVGVIASVFSAGLLESVRGTIGATNVAVVLTFIVIAASSLGDRLTGLVVGLVAALSYNFFHTQPYRTLRISSGKDVLTVCLLAVTDIFVGQLTSLRHRMTDEAVGRAAELRRLHRVVAMVGSGEPLHDVWTAVRAAIMAELKVSDVQFEPVGVGLSANDALPSIGVNGGIEGAALTFESPGFTLPAEGVTVPVAIGPRLLGRLVLTPGKHVGTTGEQRRTAVALAQQLAIALPTDGTLVGLR